MGYSGAILKNKEGKILFQLRDKNGRNPNKWGIFGGGIKKNESPEQALMRELREELSINLTKSDILKKHTLPLFDYHIFEVKLRRIPPRSHLKEGKAMKLMTKEEFLKTKNALWRVKAFLRLFRID